MNKVNHWNNCEIYELEHVYICGRNYDVYEVRHEHSGVIMHVVTLKEAINISRLLDMDYKVSGFYA